jgi:hypothetical protein
MTKSDIYIVHLLREASFPHRPLNLWAMVRSVMALVRLRWRLWWQGRCPSRNFPAPEFDSVGAHALFDATGAELIAADFSASCHGVARSLSRNYVCSEVFMNILLK